MHELHDHFPGRRVVSDQITRVVAIEVCHPGNLPAHVPLLPSPALELPRWQAHMLLDRVRVSPHRARRPPAVSKMPRRGYQWLRRECGSVSIVRRAGVPGGKRIMVMSAQITAVLDSCQLFLSRHKLEGGTTHEKLLFIREKA